ncbi:unnamed protein product [Paramecium octaurelia]|uniref:Uncharacterized protein n=1 Tax=Paramecium octaurelia TaxID=43137 RepID=A0A8S1STW8_PAROT|nr:unnamed protein product [Paramecium octaurelia]
MISCKYSKRDVQNQGENQNITIDLIIVSNTYFIDHMLSCLRFMHLSYLTLVMNAKFDNLYKMRKVSNTSIQDLLFHF